MYNLKWRCFEESITLNMSFSFFERGVNKYGRISIPQTAKKAD